MSHFAKVVDSRRYDWDAKFTCQVGYTAGSGSRRVRKNQHAGIPEQLGNVIFGNISGELIQLVAQLALGYGFDVAFRHRVVAASNDKPDIRHLRSQALEGLDQQFQSLIGSPFTERENVVLRASTQAEVGSLGPATQNAVGAEVHVRAPVLVDECAAISRQAARK